MAVDPSINFDPGSLRVLVVDDSAPMRGILGSILKSHGVFDIEMASDGLAALQQVRRRDFDFIICDLMMRGMDGFEFLRNLRTGLPSPSSETPTIILSSNADLNSILQARDAGMNEYLVKPVSSRMLWKRVVSVMKTSHNLGQGKAITAPSPRASKSSENVDAGSGEASDEKRRPDDDAGEVFSPELMTRYRVILKKEVDAISELVEEMSASREPSRSDWLDLVRKTHDLKGHSGSFGYFLISGLAHAFCELSRNVLDNMNAFRDRRRLVLDVVVKLSDAIKYYASHDVLDAASEQPKVQTLRDLVSKLGVDL